MMDMYDAISHVLRAGVMASLLLIAIGAILLFSGGGSNGFTLSQIASANAGINSSAFSFPSIIYGLTAYQGLDFILLGVIVLIATPVMRVLLSVFAFIYDRNWLYATITLIVFIDLIIAVFVVPGLLVH